MEETMVTPQREPRRGLTFDDVWAALMEDRERQKEMEQMFKEQAREMREWQKVTDKIVRRNGKQMGELHNRFGELAEHLVAPGIAKRFNELGYHFDRIASRGQKIYDQEGNIKAEIDLALENGGHIIAVEVKTKPALKDIDHHIKRLQILREARNKWRDNRKILGAIAGAIFPTELKEAVIEAGLYVLEQSGDTMKIYLPGGFVPREW